MNTFVPLDIIDGNGERWQPKPVQRERAARVSSRDKNWCGGFNVLGFTEEMIAKAEEERITENIELEKLRKPKLATFNREAYLRNGKPMKLNGKAFALESAANEYAELQRKAGRVGVHVKMLVAAR